MLLSFPSVAFPVMIDSFLYSIAVVFMTSYSIVVVSVCVSLVSELSNKHSAGPA